MEQKQTMNQIPTTFWAQLIARFQGSNPRFFNIIKKYAFIAPVVSWGLSYIVGVFLPGVGITIPQWLIFTKSQVIDFNIFVTGLGLGAAGVAQTTIETPSTPPLETGEVKPTVEDLLKRITELENRQSQPQQ